MKIEEINQEITEMQRKSRVKAVLMLIGFIVLIGSISYLAFHTVSQNVAGNTATETKIVIADSGFEPSTIVVKRGTTVVWHNNTASPHTLGANPYPTHESLTALYTKQPISPRQTYSFTFNKAGTWQYSDYGSPTLSGTVIVQ